MHSSRNAPLASRGAERMPDTHASQADPAMSQDPTDVLRWVTPGCTITEAHVVMFTGICGDYFPLHVDAEYAAGTEFGTRLVQGPLLYAMAVGLVSRSPALGDDVLAFLGAADLRHTAPCFIGETVRVVVTERGSRPTRDPGRRIRTLEYETLGRGDRRLMTATMTFLTRGVGDPAGPPEKTGR